ncbi:glycine--tRNA ligase subunit beta [Collinsella sp. AF08-23]|uniref:glycine--tRNA ligase subunit beta n=1 Tax=Collinsella sp. AF08-23 TaxID=2292211 RepID=UPI000E494666|nr:glycine--tRNA ligase subunit beta [Collinsella sp. AF08-23]RHS39600.1 glycine--tRNA ligase subunit beta [Collinsella sp. AF08-23]
MAGTRDFLFELGVEEMPSAPLNNAVKQLKTLISKGLDDAGLAHGDVRIISSPRRLAALVLDVAEATEEIHSVLRGPSAKIAFDAEGNPTKAAEGFARKNGMTAAELVRREDADGTEYVFAEQNTPSEPAVPILTRVCEDLIPAIQWPNYRSQRWGSEHATFVRPVRWICCLFGEEVVPVSFADVKSGSTTRGHRVLSPGEHVVSSAASYEQVLEAAHVLSAERREEVIRAGIARVEDELGVRVDTPTKIFDEVVNFCEWPTVLVGHFDEEFLAVPSEIICESMLSNQRYFPTYDAEGKLTRAFVVVSNADPAVSETVVDGNERVVRARLYDAKFFYDEDLKIDLEEFRARLANVGFQKKLGTVLQKSDRMEDLALAIANEAHLGAHAASDAQRAAHLAKADLVSSAVVEFTSQQGVMGGYYATAAGEEPAVAAAIRDHYRPRFAGDELPEGIAGCVVAVADKLDTIAGMFAIGEPPTGSKDPFALRRSAIGVLNILRDRLGCGYEAIVDAALDGYLEQGLAFDKDEVEASVCAFIKGRMEQMVRDEKISADTVAAVSAGSVTVPAQYFQLAHALEDARANDREAFDNLATAYARAAHLADAVLGSEVDSALMGDAERVLLEATDAAQANVDVARSAKDFTAVIAALAALREPIDAFFDEVMVMDEDEALRANRLRLLNRFESVFAGIANIGEMARK